MQWLRNHYYVHVCETKCNRVVFRWPNFHENEPVLISHGRKMHTTGWNRLFFFLAISPRFCLFPSLRSLLHVFLTLSLEKCLIEFCKVTLTFQYVDEILWCDRNPSNLMGSWMWPFKWKFSPWTHTWCYLFSKMLRNAIWKSGRNLWLYLAVKGLKKGKTRGSQTLFS